MSTRATYRFHSADGPTVTIYKHHDGYPEGAACWLYNAFRHRKRGLAAGFLRGNEDAEITTSHEAHGDTEFRYDITEHRSGEPSIEASARGDGQIEWRSIHSGMLRVFIERHGKFVEAWTESYSPIITVDIGEDGGLRRAMTLKEAEEQIASCVRYLGLWTIEKPLSMENGNARSMRNEIKALRAAIQAEHSRKTLAETL